MGNHSMGAHQQHTTPTPCMIATNKFEFQFFYAIIGGHMRANEEEDWGRMSIFRTHVAYQGRLYTMIIDRSSSFNL